MLSFGGSLAESSLVGYRHNQSHKFLPDFNSVNKDYARSIARGRNPKSIPRNSELWYYVTKSSQRLSRISKGHKFRGVINDEIGIEAEIPIRYYFVY